MKKYLCLILCALMLTGCAAGGQEPADVTQPQMHSFQVYYGDENAEAFLSKPVQANSVTEQIVLAALVAQGVVPEDTAVHSLEVKDGVVHLDLNDAFRSHLVSLGTAGERMLIGSVVNTFLSAYDAEAVVLTVDGNTLESGHAVYDQPISFME